MALFDSWHHGIQSARKCDWLSRSSLGSPPPCSYPYWLPKLLLVGPADRTVKAVCRPTSGSWCGISRRAQRSGSRRETRPRGTERQELLPHSTIEKVVCDATLKPFSHRVIHPERPIVQRAIDGGSVRGFSVHTTRCSSRPSVGCSGSGRRRRSDCPPQASARRWSGHGVRPPD